jgi:hypothetical protein
MGHGRKRQREEGMGTTYIRVSKGLLPATRPKEHLQDDIEEVHEEKSAQRPVSKAPPPEDIEES